jgi:hypothetical protein
MLQNGFMNVTTVAKSADGARTATVTQNGKGSPVRSYRPRWQVSALMSRRRATA